MKIYDIYMYIIKLIENELNNPLDIICKLRFHLIPLNQ